MGTASPVLAIPHILHVYLCLKASQALECESKDRLCSCCCFDQSFLDMLFPLSYSEITFGNLFDSEAHKWVNVYIFGLAEL